MGGGGEGPLTAGGKLARKRRCSDGRRREEMESGRREGDQNDRGENLNPFYSLAFSDGRDHGDQTGANRATGVRGQDRRGKILKVGF